MNATATSTPPAGLRRRHVRLTRGLASASDARAEVRAAVSAWHLPVDTYVAALLTSELVANAIQHEASPSVTLAITSTAGTSSTGTSSAGRLRVDVHDTSRAMPAPAGAAADADAETGRGLILVAALADEWGFYGTADGKAVYFSLAFPRGT